MIISKAIIAGKLSRAHLAEIEGSCYSYSDIHANHLLLGGTLSSCREYVQS